MRLTKEQRAERMAEAEAYMQTEEPQQRCARIKGRFEILDWIKREEKCLVLFQRAMAALEAGDHRGWRRRMKRICELSGIDQAQYDL